MQSPWPCVNSARSGGQGGCFATGIWVMQQFAMENEACIMVYLFIHVIVHCILGLYVKLPQDV
jgi:hypothetical protein